MICSILNFRDYVYKENENSVKFLSENITKNSIVVTHHLPTYKSVHPKYHGSELNRFFVCEMDNIIEKNKPNYWLHGHSHENQDYRLFNSKVICNPYGYPGESKDFISNKIIEV